MDRAREQMLELLRSNIWGTTPSVELFKDGVEWGKVLKNASNQAVPNIVSAQMSTLPKEYLPPLAQMLKLHSNATMNRTTQLRQIASLGEIQEHLFNIGITKPVLLKGAGVGLNYPDPSLRQCGDIDLYVGEKHYDKVCKEALKWEKTNVKSAVANDKHLEFIYDTTPIEIHRWATRSSEITKNNKAFKQWMDQQLDGDTLRRETINGVEVYLPPYNFDAIFIFLHAWLHYCKSGIAIRQICDWALYLVHNNDKIDKVALEADIKRFGLAEAWGYFTSVIVTQLGVSPDILVLYDERKNKKAAKIMGRIWTGGNFGYHSDKKIHNGVKIRLSAKLESLFFLFSIDYRYAFKLYLGLFKWRIITPILKWESPRI